MDASPGASIIIYSNGIPISPADLDFGNAATQAQINALSSFSQMVNAIPSPGNVWIPTGTATWSVYNLVLTMSDFAQSAQSPSPPPSLATRSVPIDGSDESLNVPAPAAKSVSAIPAVMESLGAMIFPELSYIGFELGERELLASNVNNSVASSVAPPPENDSPETSGGLSALFLQLESQLKVDAMTDTLGNVFYPTYLFPADFYQPQYDASWKPFTVTPGQSDPWIPIGDQGGTVTGEIIILPLQRAWWSTWVFANRGWRFNPASGFGDVSDGNSPPQGMMPMYASALIIARNIQYASPSGTAASAPSQSDTNPFILKDDGGNAATDSSVDSVPSDSMLILGFVCMPLPLSPNPDPSLNWGN